ncbi:hypothetical protein ABPG77_011122 [Micractinium sp. CCAP 211/92]
MDGMGGAAADHAGHNHTAHDHASHNGGMEGMDMSKYMGSVERLPNGGYHYPHGAFLGHVVPGAFFLVWGFWWTVATFATYVQCLAARRGFQTRAWRLLPWGPPRLRSLPLEPVIKILLPACGILGEIWLGHESWRNLYASDGKFYTDNLNDWQHSTMYLSFMASGVVDLLGHYVGAPRGAELAFLALSFMSEGLLLVFHLKGPRVEILVHLILVLQVFSTVVAIFVELGAPSSILAASARPWLTMLQGAWWIQTAYIMYKSAPQWDPDYMGSGMMVPVPFVLWSLGIAFFMFCLLLAFKAVAERRLGRPLSFGSSDGGEDAGLHPHHQLLHGADDDEPGANGFGSNGYAGGGMHGSKHGRADRDVELSGLVLKTYAGSHAA